MKVVETVLIIGIITIAILLVPDIYADTHYYYGSPQPQPYPYYYNPYPYRYDDNNDDFFLVVRLIVDDEYMEDYMPDFTIKAGGKTKHIDGDEFEDDGRAKVTFTLDRDDLDYREKVRMESDDDRYHGSQYFYTSNNSYSVSWKLLD